MAEFNTNSATTTNFTDVVPDFIVNAKALDVAQNNGAEFHYHYFDKATQNFGYYSQIPEIFSAANAMANYSVGLGWETEDMNLKIELEHVTGMGKDSFDQVIWNHVVVKLIVGDAFAEVKRKENKIINIIPISPERIRIALKDGRIDHYDTWNGTEWKKIDKENMLHSSNKRIGDQCHGTSQIDACKWIIDARNEALLDNRKIQHRSLALGIAYYKTDNAGKIAYANSQIEKAVKNGEMVGLPEGTVEIREFPSKDTSDRLESISYYENFFYQVFGVPRSIVSSDGLSEVGGKMGYVTFSECPARIEARFMEYDLWNQQAIKIKFNHAPSLGGMQPELDEGKNTGQLNIQPNDVTANMNRE